MSRPFHTLNSLLRLMRKRNIQITPGSEGSKVKRILSRENYYAVINGYKDIFIDTVQTKAANDDRYIVGTTFFHIYSLYCFDRNLRSILLKGILQAEQNLCTKISYRFSESYSSEFSHLNINNFSNSNLHEATKLISKLSNVTQQNTKGDVFKHYLTNHKDLPLWVLVTKLTFGEITNFFKLIQSAIQEMILNDIHNDYKIEFRSTITPHASAVMKDFINILDTLVAYRNICAHGERLYNHRVRNKSTIRRLSYYFITSPRGGESSCYGVLICLKLLLPRLDYQKIIDDVISEISQLSQELPTPQFRQVLSKMELTLSWQQTLNNLK